MQPIGMEFGLDAFCFRVLSVHFADDFEFEFDWEVERSGSSQVLASMVYLPPAITIRFM